MRLTCPHCGNRGIEEFAYGGDAGRRRPDGEPFGQAWMDYVYLRRNPAGAHREWWYHASGCRAWLVVTRDTTTHVVASVQEVAR